VQSSCDAHMILEGCCIPEVWAAVLTGVSGSGLGMQQGQAQWIQSGVIRTDQVGESLRGVGEVTL